MNKFVITDLSYSSITNDAEQIRSKIDNVESNCVDLTEELAKQKLEQKRLQDLLIDSELRQLETANQIYQSIKTLSEKCENTNSKIFILLEDLECKTNKRIKKLIYGIISLSILDLILIGIQIISF